MSAQVLIRNMIFTHSTESFLSLISSVFQKVAPGGGFAVSEHICFQLARNI